MSDNSLEQLQNFINDVNATNSSNDKLAVIKRYPQCQELWRYVYDNINYQYGVTSANIKKMKGKWPIGIMDASHYPEIKLLLNDLNNRLITGHAAIRVILSFIEFHKQYEELILNIIDRNLKTRTDAKLFNKAFLGCIPQFEVALATDINEYDPDRKKIDFEKDGWYASRKLDGCRCIAKIYSPDNIRIFSRNGKEFLTLQKIKDELAKLNLHNTVLDGEICLVDSNGNENFQEVMKVIRKKDHTIPNPFYKIFDMIDMAQFDATEDSVTLFWDRQNNLSNKIQTCDFFGQVAQTRVNSWEHLEELKNQALSSKWEGLILRMNKLYKSGRSNDMLKVKYFKDAEFEVKQLEMGPIRFIDYDANGKSFEKEEDMLSAIKIEYKGNIVRVGSGFTISERKYYYENPHELIGKQVTVKYFESTTNQSGNESLRFPTVKKIFKDGTREEEE